jgi:DNA-directed RNA polymerase sigma subunit (sigma70/sigma32)
MTGAEFETVQTVHPYARLPEVEAMLAFISHTAEERVDWLLAAGLDEQELRVLTLLGCVDGRLPLTERRAACRLGVTLYRLRKIKQGALGKVRAQWRREQDENGPDAHA